MLPVVQTEQHPVQAPPEPITVAFETIDGPVSGIVSVDGGEPSRFHGWLELMDALERLRDRPA